RAERREDGRRKGSDHEPGDADRRDDHRLAQHGDREREGDGATPREVGDEDGGPHKDEGRRDEKCQHDQEASQPTMTSAMRPPAWPSHSGGLAVGASGPSSRIRPTAATTCPGSTSWFVPWVTVIGRSVLGRTVRHGTPRIVGSSRVTREAVTL